MHAGPTHFAKAAPMLLHNLQDLHSRVGTAQLVAHSALDGIAAAGPCGTGAATGFCSCRLPVALARTPCLSCMQCMGLSVQVSQMQTCTGHYIGCRLCVATMCSAYLLQPRPGSLHCLHSIARIKGSSILLCNSQGASATRLVQSTSCRQQTHCSPRQPCIPCCVHVYARCRLLLLQHQLDQVAASTTSHHRVVAPHYSIQCTASTWVRRAAYDMKAWSVFFRTSGD